MNTQDSVHSWYILPVVRGVPTTTGLKGMLLSHNNSISHKQAVVAWSIYAVKIIQTHLKEQ